MVSTFFQGFLGCLFEDFLSTHSVSLKLVVLLISCLGCISLIHNTTVHNRTE